MCYTPQLVILKANKEPAKGGFMAGWLGFNFVKILVKTDLVIGMIYYSLLFTPFLAIVFFLFNTTKNKYPNKRPIITPISTLGNAIL
jgi:hypothetical protein